MPGLIYPLLLGLWIVVWIMGSFKERMGRGLLGRYPTLALTRIRFPEGFAPQRRCRRPWLLFRLKSAGLLGERRRGRIVRTGVLRRRSWRMFLGDYLWIENKMNPSSDRGVDRVPFAKALCVAELPGLHLPGVTARRQKGLHAVASAVGMQDFDLESAEFNRRFRVTGRDRRAVWNVLSAELMRRLVNSPKIEAFAVCGRAIMIVVPPRPARIPPPYRHLACLMMRLLAAFPRHVLLAAGLRADADLPDAEEAKAWERRHRRRTTRPRRSPRRRTRPPRRFRTP